jgi:hypothetical protein
LTYDLALGRSGHDLVFEKLPVGFAGQQRYAVKAIAGADQVAQQIKMTLLTFLGEWFLDIGFGVPYLEEILIKNPRLTSVESILRAKIKAVPDVEKITDFAMEFNRRYRTLRVDFTAHTLLGAISDSVTLDLLRRS